MVYKIPYPRNNATPIKISPMRKAKDKTMNNVRKTFLSAFNLFFTYNRPNPKRRYTVSTEAHNNRVFESMEKLMAKISIRLRLKRDINHLRSFYNRLFLHFNLFR